MKLIYDASIRKWRKRTPADDIYVLQVIQAVKALEGK